MEKYITKLMKSARAYHAHNNHGKNDKYLIEAPDQTIISNSILPTAFSSNENDAMR